MKIKNKMKPLHEVIDMLCKKRVSMQLAGQQNTTKYKHITGWLRKNGVGVI